MVCLFLQRWVKRVFLQSSLQQQAQGAFPLCLHVFLRVLVRLPEQPIRVLSVIIKLPPIVDAESAKKLLLLLLFPPHQSGMATLSNSPEKPRPLTFGLVCRSLEPGQEAAGSGWLFS